VWSTEFYRTVMVKLPIDDAVSVAYQHGFKTVMVIG
jgi:hypothetical protein